ncbi:D-alanyl-D-alanine carboxypeptidase precursor [Legionella massiliensis]|uniref:D-alanyl-D-alanine carboxypeptidase n=1 Tax=Legionella massiliensis TaxID=1034943 RepID=A0A078KX60_9GAMM|nr:serine hydrolase domain-containing protein [Legionella massiliensis]CDZ76288.1 D-alanyl-D-alanine carboxypeptidase precursor [Legionella massiliensis]CEE12026.1 D-alanyl-D-alanine carboxypeptidase precursor [Legionella massiliensis]
MQKMSKMLIVSLLAVLPCLQNPAYAEISQSWLDAKIQAFIKDKPVKAMIYGLWINGEPVSVQATGESMTAVPATKDMHFRIGGVTETMLTTLLMQMVEQKVVKLDDKISRWYPDLPNADLVNLKMLANCTSGYPDFVYNKKFIDVALNQPFKQWTDKELIDFAFMEAPLFKPDTDQHYTHTDFVLLGAILSQAGKKPLKGLLHSYILKPLAMRGTEFNLTATMLSPTLHSFSQDRGVYEDATFWDPSWTAASGAVNSTIDDLGRWAEAWMQGNLLSAESTQKLRAPDTVGKGKNREDRYFAMGFAVVNHWLIQNPRFGGYSGFFAVLPEKNMVFIAFNTLKADDKESPNFSMELWKQLAGELAPEYPSTL